jgi:transposase
MLPNKLDIALDDKYTIIVANDEEDFTKLLKAVSHLDSVFFVKEATGGYEKPLANVLQSKGYAVAVVNAKRVRDYANALWRPMPKMTVLMRK